ncbi:MAG: hypothetical protein ACI32F_07200 [Allobaculum sp.]
MKQLQTIQKGMHIFEVLTKIFMVIAIVWAILVIGGLIGISVWKSGGSFAGLDADTVLSWTGVSGMNELTSSMIENLVMAMISIVLCVFAGQYFKTEQADGTPFSDRGAYLVRRLGILNIALSIAGAVLCGIISEILNVGYEGWGDGDNLVIGFILLLLSYIFQYGAELENRPKAGNREEE